MQTISIIIPVLNEANLIGNLVSYLKQHGDTALKEIIVVDGNSDDDTVSIARKAGAKVIECNKCGRAHQMNKGASIAEGTILFFVHVDTVPPNFFIKDLLLAVDKGYKIGCYRAKYQSNHLMLRLNSYCTRFQKIWCRGGDQTLFITRSFFEQLGAYREDCKIMEEYELIQKAQTITDFYIIPKDVLVSTRKYEGRGYLRIQLASLIAFYMYNRKHPDEKIAATYRKLLGGIKPLL